VFRFARLWAAVSCGSDSAADPTSSDRAAGQDKRVAEPLLTTSGIYSAHLMNSMTTLGPALFCGWRLLAAGVGTDAETLTGVGQVDASCCAEAYLVNVGHVAAPDGGRSCRRWPAIVEGTTALGSPMGVIVDDAAYCPDGRERARRHAAIRRWAWTTSGAWVACQLVKVLISLPR